MTKGHNIRRFDDRLKWAFLHRAMSDDIFLTHTKKYQRFRLDTLDLAKIVALLDQDGENGLKPGVAKKSGFQSFSLSNLMEANTRDPIPERGLDEGVRMPDGSKHDHHKAHADAAYDVDATMALDAYLRKRAPDVVRILEINSDFDRIKPFVIGGEGFGLRPVRAFARYVYPNPASLHFGVCAGINEEIEERRQAVMIRTDTDQMLADYSFRGKKLIDMSVEDLEVMLKSQRGKSDALCEVIDLRKNPPVIDASMAFYRGKGGNPERHEANRRFVLEHEGLCHKLMQAHSQAMPAMPDYKTIRNPQAEEHLFTGIAQPKRYEFEMDGKKVLLTETVHAEWVKALRRNRSIDAVLRRAIKPQTVEFESRQDTLEAFIDRMQSVDKHLQKYFGTADDAAPPPPAASESDVQPESTQTETAPECPFKMLPAPSQSFIPPKWDYIIDPDNKTKRKRVPHTMSDDECKQLSSNAIEYLWKLRAELMHEFHDNSTMFTVQDQYGHNIDFPTLNRMKQSDLADRLRTGEYKIHMEELNWSTELIARMFRDAGRIEWVKGYMAEQGRDEEVRQWEAWERYFADLRALRMHGVPHADVDQQRWMTAQRSLKEIARIRDNLRTGDIRADEEEWGGWDRFMRGTHQAERILSDCEKLAHRQLAENPLSLDDPATHARMRRLGYDPDKRGLPIEHASYELPANAKTLTIDVPDRMLEMPLSHHHVATKILMLDPDDAQRQALNEAAPDTYLLLRGAQSGRTFLAAKPVILPADKIAPTPYFQEIYAAAANRYEDSGTMPPAPAQFLPLAVEALEPIPSKINMATQTVKIARWEDFIATVSPALGYREEKLTGLVIKDEMTEAPSIGSVRLQGMITDENKPGQTESGWEVPTTINRVRTLTLKEVRDRINVGREQIKAAVALGLESVEAVRTLLASDEITEDQITGADLKSRKSLINLMEKESFTPHDATHYGYASLTDMRSKLTAMFVDHDLEANRVDNRIHFLDIEPADKAEMHWYQPARRSTVIVADTPPPPPPPSSPLSSAKENAPWTQVVDRNSDKPRSHDV